MRVLHLGKYFPPYPGGIERFTEALAGAQQRAGLTPAVLAHGTARCAAAALDYPVQLVRSHGSLLFVPLAPGWRRACRRQLREFRPDLLHVHLPNPSAFWLLTLPEARRLPWLLHWHADVPDDTEHRGLRLAYPAYRLFERALLRRAAAIVATSHRYREASTALAPFQPRTRVIPLGLDAAPAAGGAPDWPSGGLRLLAVGRLAFYKGFEYLLEALARLDDVSLLLIGDGEREPALRARIDALGLQARVRLLGRADDATLEAAYRACDLFCLPSIDRAEAFGLVLLEAMRAGKPVLASAIPGSGVGEVVRDGETGLLVPPRDPLALAEAISRLRDHPSLRAAYGEAGRRRWQSALRIEPVAEQFTSLYRELLAASATGS